MSGHLSFHAGSRHTTYAASLAERGEPVDFRGGWLHTTIVPGLSYGFVEEAFPRPTRLVGQTNQRCRSYVPDVVQVLCT
jgi:hypothetical protein